MKEEKVGIASGEPGKQKKKIEIEKKTILTIEIGMRQKTKNLAASSIRIFGMVKKDGRKFCH